MKTKQLVAIIVTGVVIIAVGVTGVMSNVISNKILNKERTATLMSDIATGEDSVSLPSSDFIGVINIVGEIGASDGWMSKSEYNHTLYMNYIDQMMDSKKNKGIMLYVDSPGGTVYESDELYLKLMEYKQETGRPVYAYFASQACSGGYYISMAADKIYANRNCWTGSIGVIISLVNYKELYEKLGIKEIDITSGENKAMGSSALDLTDEQRDILQSLVDEAFDQFVGIVCDGRGMEDSAVRKLADGRLYTAQQALDNGLVDYISSEEDMKSDFISECGFSDDILFYEPNDSIYGFMNTLFGTAQELLPKTESDLVKDIIDSKGNGVLKYYAE